MTKSLNLTPAVLTMAFIATAAGEASAAGETTKNVAQLECKAVMRLGDEDRTATIAFLHGYVAGKKGQMDIDVSKLSEATDKLMDDCLDHPKDKALDVLCDEELILLADPPSA